ncbi:autotransporter outer membrane beta-barrel domain-containing protein [Oxalobacter aliiformigenes]|uniref:Autotransporter outer membrane beta-barrel domain-containing protein n=1 Tax=Oxalobacter aliiformigenes TaxID=2946593 RepID=A0ABY7JKM2_9BURK|nr:autotransporter outer membrane beta-barrel domain-containing protein [Oxalobacter aliiformigenes]WAV92387.1 autotransporter outer membrane beta-barrel domain-containing protein [Oxalobacter aliiformigenes]WAV96103.1 autotransporter outer membrane beta-barrel domain-containing protein [Oxalobacter aliiformigenes]WAV97981.1 autotransporter outer membrane beta-barrel domain-containing protein [Oxalobacter aliiformigenes]
MKRKKTAIAAAIAMLVGGPVFSGEIADLGGRDPVFAAETALPANPGFTDWAGGVNWKMSGNEKLELRAAGRMYFSDDAAFEQYNGKETVNGNGNSVRIMSEGGGLGYYPVSLLGALKKNSTEVKGPEVTLTNFDTVFIAREVPGATVHVGGGASLSVGARQFISSGGQLYVAGAGSLALGSGDDKMDFVYVGGGTAALSVNNYVTSSISIPGKLEIHAKKAVFEGNGGDEQGKETIAVAGGQLVLDVDDVSVNGNIRVGISSSGVASRTDKSGSSVTIGSDDAFVRITGDVAVSSAGGSLAVNMSGEASSFTGTVTEVMAKDDQGQEIVNSMAGTRFTAGDGATIHLTGDSAIRSVTSNGAIINTGTNTLKIGELVNREKGTTISTESIESGQIEIGNNRSENEGKLTLVLNKKASEALSGDNRKAAEQIAEVIKLGETSTSGYQAQTEEDDLLGKRTVDIGADGTILSVSEAKNTVTDSLQKIGAMNFLTFRAQINDVSKRMGDLRSMPQADGMWARAIAGQSEYKSIHNTYQTLQIGADKRIGNIYVGGTASYTDGEGKLDNGSTDDKNWSFGLYGGWIADDGQYIDIIIKRHKLDTDFDLHTQSGTGVNGRYHTWGTSASVEYGWRLGIADTDYYIEPQAELMIGHLNGVSHTTNVGTNIKQEGIDTAVGRVGIAAGWISPEKTGSAYLKASVLHDWEGDAKTRVSNKKAMRSYTEDMGGTWGEFALGGTWNINKSLAAYGEVETTAGNPVRTTYQVSGGIRYSF